jgi:diaminohydroxyphosphoribosylaminopyrimidine deaminase / 5-amino-6-(5-phosphoribosylamino)uracil reductase
MFTEFDRLAMTRALALAERGLETTHPNPRVGCVIAKGDRIIAEGWHERAGEAHAEVAAIRAAKEPVAGATAYVTLEPCSHHGRTPPCVNALIEARIARVVFAVQDPNPRVSGQGADALLRAGITVEAGLMQAEASELNIGFMKRMREGLPWVRVKLAMSLDGRTALANGASQWITSEHSRNDVQRWRARCSAVMTGVGTVLADDPQLNVRVAGFKGRQPLRVVLDARLRSPVGAKMFVGLGASRVGGVAAAASGSAAGAVAVAAAAPAGDILIFTAIGGGVSAAGSERSGSAAPAGPAALAGGIAELVNAFETSPTSVAARSADLAGPVSMKAEAPSPAAASGTSAGVPGPSTRAAGGEASGATNARGATVPGSAGTPAAGVAASGTTDARGATPTVAGAAPRGGAPSPKVTPKADTPAAFQARRAALLACGVRIEEVAADDDFLHLCAVLKKLAELEVNEVLVEAGPTLAGQLLTTFLVDELLLYIAPKLLGPQGRPLVNLPELQSLQDAWGFSLFDAKRFGDDLRLRMRPK